MRLEREAGLLPANDNNPRDDDDAEIEWAPRRQRVRRGREVYLPGDRPDPHRLAYIVQQRLLSDAAGEPRDAENDNWPLAKVLRRDGLLAELALAERYRAIHDAACMPVELVGRDPGELRVAARLDLDESTGTLRDKGVRCARGGNHPNLDHEPLRALRTSPDQPRAAAKAAARRWQGDNPLLAKIDAQEELHLLRMELGWLADAFESAVVDGDRLEDIGRRYGAGQAAGGAGRALVMLGLKAMAAHWSCLPMGKIASRRE